jgi:prepilin-type N-terminal cleavage/methylation domain-containing protein
MSRGQLSKAGFTVVELIVVLAVISILAWLAVPAYGRQVELSRLKAAAELLFAAKRQAKSDAIMQDKTLTVVLAALPGGSWCIGTTEKTDCDCSTGNLCHVKGVSRVLQGDDFPTIRLSYASAARRYIFKPTHGAMAAGSAVFSSPSGYEIRVVTSRLGRIRLCSPAGSGYVAGYPKC